MKQNAIIFDLKYTPYKLPKNATEGEVQSHKNERTFFDLSGDRNLLKYVATESKRECKKSALKYLQKGGLHSASTTGVFNSRRIISHQELEKMKERIGQNKGNLWHGFISLSKEDSPKIDTPEKCIELVKKTFNSFFREGGFSGKNMDLMCALHLDKPHHLHIHFEFWEKEPKTYDKFGNKSYRAKGKVNKRAIDNMYVRIADYLYGNNKSVYDKRVDALAKLKMVTRLYNINLCSDEIKNEIISLAKDLPKNGRISYGSEDMKPFRTRVDSIVQMLISSDNTLKKADRKFRAEIEKKQKLIYETCKQPHSYASGKGSYRYDINEKNITLIDEIKYDYARRQGNLVLGIAKIIKPEIYERKRKSKVNDNKLKKNLSMSNRKIASLYNKFIASFWQDCNMYERDFTQRLQEIEKELENDKKEKENNYKS